MPTVPKRQQLPIVSEVPGLDRSQTSELSDSDYVGVLHLSELLINDSNAKIIISYMFK